MNKLYPALLSTPMVHAHKEGRKTETRRLSGLDVINEHETPDCWTFEGFEDGKAKFNSIYPSINPRFVKMPYGNVGDFVYFKETFSIDEDTKQYVYKADVESKYDKPNNGWKPSMHMPLKAARLFGLVKEVRIERLHAITEESAIAEGIYKFENSSLYRKYAINKSKVHLVAVDALTSYESLWEQINGECSWQVNPWVWVYKYEPKTRDEVEAVLGELKTKTEREKESEKQALSIHNK